MTSRAQVQPADLVISVRCPHCGHKQTLNDKALAELGIKPTAPVADFAMRLQCGKCRRGGIVAARVARSEAARPRARA
jgi:ribosomal protein S27E